MRPRFRKYFVILIACLLLGGLSFGYWTEAQVFDPTVDKGIVSLTFDDANKSQYEIVLPILASRNQKGVLYAPTGFIGTEGYMTWPQVIDLQNKGWEIGGHGVNHLELPEVNNRTLNFEVNQSYADLSAHGIQVTTFALPFGAYDNRTQAAVAKKFNAIRAFHNQGYNRWPYNKYLLYVRYITNQTTVAQAKSWVDEAITQGNWLILVFHEVLPIVDTEDTYSWRIDQLEEFLDFLSSQNIKAKTLAEVLPPVANLLPNSSFEAGLTSGWITDNPSRVVINTANNGSYPFPKNSIRMTGSSRASHLFSPRINVVFGTTYGVRGYTDTRNLSRGEVGYYIDEYDEFGNWISGQWLGGVTQKNVIDESYRYRPTSNLVKSASLQVYITAGASGSVYIDNLEFWAP